MFSPLSISSAISLGGRSCIFSTKNNACCSILKNKLQSLVNERHNFRLIKASRQGSLQVGLMADQFASITCNPWAASFKPGQTNKLFLRTLTGLAKANAALHKSFSAFAGTFNMGWVNATSKRIK